MLSLNDNFLYRLFKYGVYAALMLNIYLFFAEEWAAVAHRFGAGVSLADLIEAFASTIDTSAWVVLLLMFELETYVLDDRHLTPGVTRLLRVLRAFCFTIIAYALYGYIVKLLFLLDATPLADIDSTCSLIQAGWSYAYDLDEYALITAENCSRYGLAGGWIQFPGVLAITDSNDYREIVRLAWTDVINSATWIGVVIVLEADVRLHDKGLLTGTLRRLSTALKLVFLYDLARGRRVLGIQRRFRRLLGCLPLARCVRLH